MGLAAGNATPSCTTYEVLQVGHGERRALHGSQLTLQLAVHDAGTGQALQDPYQLTYIVGVDTVIDGFAAGCLGMQVGEERRIVTPPKDAYGRAPSANPNVQGRTIEFMLTCLA